MPRVKIDYIVSFSSEDIENQAQNLLAYDVTKKRWLCDKRERSCSVVLQLTRATKINALHIGAYHAALVEVLVGRSEKPNEPFEVLVPSSVFLSPGESRRAEGAGAERVRSFGADQLAAAARAQRWDRLRVVCSQPYNKHCKYGLSFVHVYEPEGKEPVPAEPGVAEAAAGASQGFVLDAPSSDEDEFRPGALFALHQQKAAGGDGGNRSTDAQIRQATSNAIKNLFDPSTKLMKTSIAKTSETNRDSPARDSGANRQRDSGANRQRDSLLYTDDDEQPHAKIDHVVNRHKDEKAKKADEDIQHRKKEEKLSKHGKEKEHRKDDSKQRNKDDNANSNTSKDTPATQRKRDGSPTGQSKDKDGDRKRRHAKDKDKKKGEHRAGPVSSTPHTLLRGVVFALSGYENPRRGAVRDQALAMGARFERDWGPACTHLICAFPNTPKLRAVRGARGGAAAAVATAEWVERCCERRRLLPWQWFATEPALREPQPSDDDDDDVPESGGDTDDSEEKAPQQKRRRTRTDEPGAPARGRGAAAAAGDRSESPHPESEANVSTGSDVTFVRDERVRGHVTVADTDSDSTVPDEADEADCEVDGGKLLPDFFDGYTFVLDEGVGEVFDKELLSRYVRAYGGLVVEASQLDEDSAVDYWIGAGTGGTVGAAGVGGTGGVRVRADWVWRCHAARALCPLAGYTVA